MGVCCRIKNVVIWRVDVETIDQACVCAQSGEFYTKIGRSPIFY